jgi:hypothetical protein
MLPHFQGAFGAGCKKYAALAVPAALPAAPGAKSYAALAALTADDPRTIVAKSTSPAAMHTAAA